MKDFSHPEQKTTGNKNKDIFSKVRCLSSMACYTKLQEEFGHGNSHSRRSSCPELTTLHNARNAIKRLSNGIEKYINPTEEVIEETEVNCRITRDIVLSAEKISNSSEQLRQLQQHLRSTGMVTNIGIQQILPELVSPKAKDEINQIRSCRRNSCPRKSIMVARGSFYLELEKCGIRWNKESDTYV